MQSNIHFVPLLITNMYKFQAGFLIVIFCGYYGQSQNFYPNYPANGVNNTAFSIPYQIPQFGQIPPQPNFGQTPWNMFGLPNPYGLNGTAPPVTYPQFGGLTPNYQPQNWNPYMFSQPPRLPNQLPYPGGYPQQYGPYPGFPQPYGQPNLGNTNNGVSEDLQPPTDSDGKLVVEIIDVSPEYQRQLLGWPSQSGDATSNDTAQPRWTVQFQGKNSTNQTFSLLNYSTPVVKHKQYVSSFKRTFVLDSSKPANFTPINIHLYNGEPVTTTQPPTTTENESVDAVDEWYDNEV